MFCGPILISLLFRGAYLRGGAICGGGAITDFYGMYFFYSPLRVTKTQFYCRVVNDAELYWWKKDN